MNDKTWLLFILDAEAIDFLKDKEDKNKRESGFECNCSLSTFKLISTSAHHKNMDQFLNPNWILQSPICCHSSVKLSELAYSLPLHGAFTP